MDKPLKPASSMPHLPYDILSLEYALPIALIAVPFFLLLIDFLKWLRLPPGPLPIPFIGNKLQLPKSKPWTQFKEWSREYGPMFTVWIGRRPTIVVSDPNIAVDLLEKRSNKYSSRPRTVAMGELYWDGASILVQPYGKAWSVRRKLLHQALTPSALRLYRPTQESEAARLCEHLLESPQRYEKHIDRFTASVVFSIAYGHRIDSLDAQVIRQRLQFMQYSASLNVPGAYAVESFPFLKHVPDMLAPWKREIKARGRIEASTNMRLVETVRSEIDVARKAASEVPDSLCKMLLDIRAREGVSLSDRDFAFIPASLFGAGSDTTASTLCSAILAMVTNPHVLETAHAELDAVIGRSRSPTFADEQSLPYVRAICKEVLRWRPVAVLGGTPHASSESDVYNGYHIPAGTTILGNSWAINLNEKYYPEPHSFEPVRFLEGTQPPGHLPELARVEKTMARLRGVPHPSRTGHSSFGWGRRICPGESLAENSLFIALAKLLWGFDILPMEGRVYDTLDYTDGFNIRPRPFPCRIEPRSEEHAYVLRNEVSRAEVWLEKFPSFE